MKFSIFLFAITVPFLSCQNNIKPTNKISSTTNKNLIINGTVVKEDSEIAKHVVLIHNVTQDYVCSGTLIMNDLVVTAAHCLTDPQDAYHIIFNVNGYEIIDHMDPLYFRKSSRVIIHPDYVLDINKQPLTDQSDIGLIYFEGNLPEGYSPVDVLYDQIDLKKNQQVVLAGYGVDHIYQLEISYKKSQKFQNRIDNGEVVCDFDIKDKDGLPTCLEIDFYGDGILRTTSTYIIYISNSEFVLDEKLTGTCSGDSGGPVFIQKNGKLFLAGLTSRGDFLCQSEGTYTSIPSHLEWILSH